MRHFVTAIAAFSMCACVNLQDQEQARYAQMAGMCASYGFNKTDPGFPECMMKLDQQYRGRYAAIVRSTLDAQRATQQQQAQQYQLQTAPAQIQSTCTSLGGIVTCNGVAR